MKFLGILLIVVAGVAGYMGFGYYQAEYTAEVDLQTFEPDAEIRMARVDGNTAQITDVKWEQKNIGLQRMAKATYLFETVNGDMIRKGFVKVSESGVIVLK